MRAVLAVAMVSLLAPITGAAACSIAKNGDYLISSGDPTLPVLMHRGKFIQCSSVFDPENGQVLDCGEGAKQIRNPNSGGVLWGTQFFNHTDRCPAIPAAFAAD